MQITIDNPFKEDDICISTASYYINEKKITPEGETITKKVFHSKVEIIFCEYRLNQFNAVKHYTGANINDIASIHIECIKKTGSKANK